MVRTTTSRGVGAGSFPPATALSAAIRATAVPVIETIHQAARRMRQRDAAVVSGRECGQGRRGQGRGDRRVAGTELVARRTADPLEEGPSLLGQGAIERESVVVGGERRRSRRGLQAR